MGLKYTLSARHLQFSFIWSIQTCPWDSSCSGFYPIICILRPLAELRCQALIGLDSRRCETFDLRDGRACDESRGNERGCLWRAFTSMDKSGLIWWTRRVFMSGMWTKTKYESLFWKWSVFKCHTGVSSILAWLIRWMETQQTHSVHLSDEIIDSFSRSFAVKKNDSESNRVDSGKGCQVSRNSTPVGSRT